MPKIDNTYKTTIVVLLLVLLIIIATISGIIFGAADIDKMFALEVLIYKIFRIGDPNVFENNTLTDIIWEYRFPRTVLALFVGVALSVSGVIMQALVKNPLANSYTLGISAGASLGATAAIMLGLSGLFGLQTVGVFAFIGATGVSFLVILISNVGGKSNSMKLLLSGMAISAICASFTSFITYYSADEEGIKSVTFWLMGNVSNARWNQPIWLIIPVAIGVTTFFVTQYRTLNMMLLGDEVAITLGRNLHKYRIFYLILTSMLVGFSVYASGIIGFVGLLVPHVARSFTGVDHKRLILVSALGGGLFLVASDVIGRILLEGGEIPIGIITSMIGGPFFLYLLIKRGYKYG